MKYVKLGCKWGPNGPNFYDMLKKHSIAVFGNDIWEKGDIVAIAVGFNIIAIAQIKGDRYPCTENPNLEDDFNKYKIDYEDWNNVADASIYELPKEDTIWYNQIIGRCKIGQPDIIEKISATFNRIMSNMLIEDCKQILLGNHNLILTGAPGTGKTYLAKEIAKSMGAVVELVQFHPSYDYSDFVEGLRPTKEDGDKEIGFKRLDGIFKGFCKKALKNGSITHIDDELIRKTYEELADDIKNERIYELKGRNKTLTDLFVNDKGEISRKRPKPDAISEPDSTSLNAIIKLSKHFSSVKELENISHVYDEFRKTVGGNTSTIYAILLEIFKRIEQLKLTDSPYVFIIDEINRGEISKIFGELFYSIDSGYRGVKGKVKTQYQNLVPDDDVFADGFFVPENVYIIGTMNDIDRSIECMDFAMRRRFAWKEITAKSRQSMLDDVNAWDGTRPAQEVIDEIKARMNNLNACIIDQYYTEELGVKDKIGLNRAYQIGASYFLKLGLYDNDFDELWANHIEGVLYEYLRGMPNIEAKMDRLKKAYNDINVH